MAPLKVLICGAGVAGPALAFWLNRIGCAVTISERSPEPRYTGQQIDVRGQGVTVMRKMGLEAAVRAHGVDEPGLQFVDGNGKRRAFFAANKTGKGKQTMTSEFEIMRGDMCRILYDVTKDKTRYIYGVHIKSFEQLQGDGMVRVAFSDGTEDTFDLLVGADGQNSTIRRLLLGPDVPDPFYPLGTTLAWVTIPSEEGDTNFFTGYVAPGGRFIATRKDREDCLRVYFLVSTTDMSEDHPLRASVKSGSVTDQKQAWADYFQDVGWRASRFLREITASSMADDWYACELGQVRMDSWSEGRIVLLGDAAFCPSPSSGMGTASALVGAYVLAGEIAQHCGLSAGDGGCKNSSSGRVQQGLPAALQSYDQKLRPFITKVQKMADHGYGSSLMPKSRLGISILYLVLGLIETLRIDKLMSSLGSDDVSGWDLPDYAELGKV
ncbi:uncharacterized protein Z518_03831 [Rhinocladiella mackenziei CBS 650.93]|uniref:FAD-binding domain-containing protein n=1 Tax=Rhinocladiella mackenziei CBS 650.93 TaxID=1442369 RepID=A0A0D2H626_9EURO|nr:uncharacterized protein Z518_03831 [Rhinocladiella mackenziei CBS 650.93]KIX05858.1 hypothetical protein Z518_03831 [Rhinocladiella mackenziei CBS 650.93]